MKRVVLRIGCGAVCTALALTLGCGCALLPPATGVPGAASSAVSVPTDDNGKPLYDPAVLNDSRLRVLYCDGRFGSSTTILCGSTPLHLSTRSENVSLVEDSATGTADYWLRSWSDPTGRGGRRTALYDKTGTEVMSFEGEQSATLQNGLLVLQESRLIDGGYVPESGYGTCQVIDLATGTALPVPVGAYSCTLCGDKLVFSCYARPEGLDDYDWDTDYQQNRWVVVQEKDGTPVYRAEAASAYRLFYDSDTLSDWVELDVATGEETTDQILYNTQTGEQYTGFLQVYPGGLASFSTGDGRYELRDMTTEDRGLIATFDEQPSQYFPGYVVTWHSGEDHGYELYDLETGAKTPLYDVDATDSTIAVYALDGSLRVYSKDNGKLLVLHRKTGGAPAAGTDEQLRHRLRLAGIAGQRPLRDHRHPAVRPAGACQRPDRPAGQVQLRRLPDHRPRRQTHVLRQPRRCGQRLRQRIRCAGCRRQGGAAGAFQLHRVLFQQSECPARPCVCRTAGLLCGLDGHERQLAVLPEHFLVCHCGRCTELWLLS